jgi:beta-lactamase class A
LLVLAIAVAAASIGPNTLRELLSAVTFTRPSAATVSSPAPHTDAELQRRLDAVAGSLGRGRLSSVVVDLETGASAAVDADRTWPAASLFKLPVLVEVLAEGDAGQLDPEQRLVIRPEDWTDGSGVLQARVGDRVSVRELTRLMIQESDNIAALVLLDAVSVAAVNTTAQRLGLPATRLVDHRAGQAGDHTTSAADMARLLLLLAAGQAVNAHVSEEALRLLELRQTFSWLGEDLPFWVKIAHKWGDLPDARHDAGLVFTPRGSYVAVVLTQDALPEDSAFLIGRTSRAAYDYLGVRPQPR